MTRPIKFRAWNLHLKRMIVPHSIPNPVVSPLGENTGASIMQFTGLYDKNGKEIYEGDIVRACGVSTPCSIEYASGKFYLSGTEFEDDSITTPLWLNVIGNIYENPELV